jgi:hypothetical protein
VTKLLHESLLAVRRPLVPGSPGGELFHFMPAPVAPAQEGQAPAQGGAIPFEVGSNLYREPPFAVQATQLDGNAHEYVFNITPGGFLRGIVLQVTSTGGVLGTTAALVADAPFSIFSSVSIEDISGGPILYPMNGFACAVRQKYLQPWIGDPKKRPDYSATINPAFTLELPLEVRRTLAVLANTDARAQYRLRFTLAPLVGGLVSVSTGVTAPTVTVSAYFETWAQPDLQDLLGNAIDGIPDGLIGSRFVQHEVPVIVSGSNVIRHTLMGNEIRALLWIFRDSTGARINLTNANTGPIDFRQDNRRLWKMTPTQVIEEMCNFYQDLANGTWTRETGVYVIPRFRDMGRDIGEYWQQTVEQTLLQAEFTGADLGSNSPGTLEIIYDQLAVAGTLPPDLEGI